MVDAFLPERIAFHFYGTIRGSTEMRRFFEDDYSYLIPGVSRHATNQIVDGECVAVGYQNLLVRYAAVDIAPELGAGEILESSDEIPAIWIYFPMLDRLRRVDGEWKIVERCIGGSMTNRRLQRIDRNPETLAPLMPVVGHAA